MTIHAMSTSPNTERLAVMPGFRLRLAGSVDGGSVLDCPKRVAPEPGLLPFRAVQVERFVFVKRK